LLISNPSLIEFLKVFGHTIYNFLYSYIHVILNYALINVSNDRLDNAELLEELSASVQYFLGKDILLSIDPEVREALLSRVKNLGKIAKSTLLI
jgi:hypothetical protein